MTASARRANPWRTQTRTLYRKEYHRPPLGIPQWLSARISSSWSCTPEPPIHGLLKLARIEWLEQVGLGSQPDGPYGEFLGSRCRNHDNREALIRQTHSSQHFQTVDLTDSDVENHPIELPRLESRQCLTAIERRKRLVAF